MTPLQLGFFASHGGSGMRALLTAARLGVLPAEGRVLISNNSASAAMQLAREAGLTTHHLSSRTHPDPAALDAAMLAALHAAEVQLVVLSGYMRALGPGVLSAYAGRILNVHPSLLPKHGGAGMYGDRVHEAVLESGEAESGATVHLVTAEYDAGPVLAQRRVPVRAGDSLDSLRARVQAAEQSLLVDVVGQIARGELKLPAEPNKAERARIDA